MSASTQMQPGLVIFDCDGVLVNTEERANRVLADWFCAAGHDVTYEYCRRVYSGRSMKSVPGVTLSESNDLRFDFLLPPGSPTACPRASASPIRARIS